MNDLVSVVMSTYNGNESDLRQAVESILNQTYHNLEFIILLDNPQNKIIYNILKEYEVKDKRVKLIINETNLGLPLSLNKGIKNAKGNYIARMDADDISLPNRIECEIEFILNNNLDMTAALKIEIDENNNIIEAKKLMKMLPNDVAFLLPYGCFLTHPSVIFKKSVIEELGGYRNISSAEDYDLWLRMLICKCRIGVIDDYLIKYRIRTDSISRQDLYKQLLTSKFLRMAYHNHSLNVDGINQEIEYYLKKNKYYDVQYRIKFNSAYNIFIRGLSMFKDKRRFTGLFMIGKATSMNLKFALMLLDIIKYKFALKSRMFQVSRR